MDKIINLAVRGRIARVTVVCQCVCVCVCVCVSDTRANGFELLLLGKQGTSKTSVLLKNTAKRSVKQTKSFKSLKNL